MNRTVFSKPAVYLNFYCPHCEQLLPHGTQCCPYCLEEIDEERSEFNVLINFALTQASSHANTISTGDPAIIFFVIGSLCIRWLKSEFYAEIPKLWTFIELVVSLIWLLPIVAIIFWFYAHGRWKILDEEYESKKKSMWLSLKMWVAAYAFHVVLNFVI